MKEIPESRSRRKGQWWKSLLVAWLALSVVGAVAGALGLAIPEAAGYPALAIGWVLTWITWRARETDDRSASGTDALAALQRVWAAFCVAVVLIGVVVITLDTHGGLTRTDTSAGIVGLGVVVTGILSLVGGRIWVPRLNGTDRASLVKSYQSRFFARVAWAEAPALVAFGGFLLLGGEAWVYAVGLAGSLADFALAAPTRPSLRRDQEKLEACGTKLDLLETLTTSGSGAGSEDAEC